MSGIVGNGVNDLYSIGFYYGTNPVTATSSTTNTTNVTTTAATNKVHV
jgi:hypothetical protein